MRDIEILNYIERNPITEADHKREVLWQIIIPAIVAVLVILAVAGLVIFGAASGDGSISTWADISLMWLILPCFFMTLTLTLVVGGLVFGFGKLLGVLPKWTFSLQNLLASLNAKVRAFSETVAKPVIKANSFWASVRAIFKRS